MACFTPCKQHTNKLANSIIPLSSLYIYRCFLLGIRNLCNSFIVKQYLCDSNKQTCEVEIKQKVTINLCLKTTNSARVYGSLKTFCIQITPLYDTFCKFKHWLYTSNQLLLAQTTAMFHQIRKAVGSGLKYVNYIPF